MYKIVCNHVMDLWKKVLRSELSFSLEGTCRRLQDLTSKSPKLKFCFRSSLLLVLSNTAAQKIQRTKKNIRYGGQNLKDY